MQNIQYITDAEGHKTAVILPIDEFEEMLEDLHFGQVAKESEDEPRRDFSVGRASGREIHVATQDDRKIFADPAQPLGRQQIRDLRGNLFPAEAETGAIERGRQLP